MRERNQSLVQHITAAVQSAPQCDEPFGHLRLGNVFPEDVYSQMLHAMPRASDYRPMSGRANYTRTEQGGGTRVKMDLFPEYVRHLPADAQQIWQYVGAALCADQVRDAFRERLASGLQVRFGEDFEQVGMYPIPILTRDVPGYYIDIHPDTRGKAITVQLYLPPDRTIEHVGTIFHKRTGDDTFEKTLQMPFSPNSGYAFVVDRHTYHSVDTVGPEVDTRDSILLTYFMDQTVAQILRNRTRRFCNYLWHEVRRLARPVAASSQ